VSWKHDRNRIDRTAAVLNSCCALVTPQQAAKRDERAKALWTIIYDMITGPSASDKDVVVPTVAALSNAGLHTVDQIAHKVLAASLSTMRAAGVTP